MGNDVRFVHSMLLDYVRVREMDQSANSKEGKVCGACKSEQLVRMTCAYLFIAIGECFIDSRPSLIVDTAAAICARLANYKPLGK